MIIPIFIIFEIALFIMVGGAIGLWPTLLLVVLSSLTGVMLVRAQGFAALAHMQESAALGTDPSREVADAGLKLVAGLFLILPGFLTSFVGLGLLFPPMRRFLLGRGAARMQIWSIYGAKPRPRGPDAETIEGEYVIVSAETDDVPHKKKPGSGWTRSE